MSGPKSNVSAWLRKAEHDLLNIENNLASKEIPWDTVCFHAQQAAEKILKAFSGFSRTRSLEDARSGGLAHPMRRVRRRVGFPGIGLPEADVLWRRSPISRRPVRAR